MLQPLQRLAERNSGASPRLNLVDDDFEVHLIELSALVDQVCVAVVVVVDAASAGTGAALDGSAGSTGAGRRIPKVTIPEMKI